MKITKKKIKKSDKDVLYYDKNYGFVLVSKSFYNKIKK